VDGSGICAARSCPHCYLPTWCVGGRVREREGEREKARARARERERERGRASESKQARARRTVRGIVCV